MPLMSHILSHVRNQPSSSPVDDDAPRKMTCRTPSSASSRSTISSNSSTSTSSSASSNPGDWNQTISLREIYKRGKLKLLGDRKLLAFWVSFACPMFIINSLKITRSVFEIIKKNRFRLFCCWWKSRSEISENEGSVFTSFL